MRYSDLSRRARKGPLRRPLVAPAFEIIFIWLLMSNYRWYSAEVIDQSSLINIQHYGFYFTRQ